MKFLFDIRGQFENLLHANFLFCPTFLFSGHPRTATDNYAPDVPELRREFPSFPRNATAHATAESGLISRRTSADNGGSRTDLSRRQRTSGVFSVFVYKTTTIIVSL